MPFENWGLTTMSTDFKKNVCGEGWIRTFLLYKEGKGESAEEILKDEQNRYELYQS